MKMSEEEETDPRSLLTREVLESAFKNDFGINAQLAGYEIKDFTKKGDNYTSLVTGVKCLGHLNGETKEANYVAKLNPLRRITVHNSLLNGIFIREATFFTEIVPKINQIIENIGQRPIIFPEVIYVQYEKRAEILISKDFKTNGYKMFDRKNGMRYDHAKLVIKELARLHAAGTILKRNLSGKNILDLYPCLVDNWLEPDSTTRENYEGFFKSCINTCINMLDQIDGYEKAKRWLEELRDEAINKYCDMLNTSPDSMRVICHGDCWNNNVMFRYDAEGNPEEVALLDLQLCRFASLSLDLNYFFYTSLTGEVRKAYLAQLLSLYYEAFEEVMTGAAMKMPFTEMEFLEETRNKLLFGALCGFMLLPVMVSEENDVLDLSKVEDNEMQEVLDKFGRKNVTKIKKNLMFRTRFLAIFDDLIESGIIE